MALIRTVGIDHPLTIERLAKFIDVPVDEVVMKVAKATKFPEITEKTTLHYSVAQLIAIQYRCYLEWKKEEPQ